MKIWEHAFFMLLWILASVLLTVFIMYIFSNKEVVRYTLDSKSDSPQLTIVKEINWDVDSRIMLDRNISYWEAIRIVDSLNATLKRTQKP